MEAPWRRPGAPWRRSGSVLEAPWRRPGGGLQAANSPPRASQMLSDTLQRLPKVPRGSPEAARHSQRHPRGYHQPLRGSPGGFQTLELSPGSQRLPRGSPEAHTDSADTSRRHEEIPKCSQRLPGGSLGSFSRGHPTTNPSDSHHLSSLITTSPRTTGIEHTQKQQLTMSLQKLRGLSLGAL